MVADNNAYYIDTTISTNIFGYSGANINGLTAWQTATSQDANSKNGDPVFAPGTIIPLSINIDNMGAPLPGVTTDQSGATRSATTPDAGALEFTGIPGDIGIMSGELKRSSGCYSTNDTLRITIKNVIIEYTNAMIL